MHATFGTPWAPMGPHGLQWPSMGTNGAPWAPIRAPWGPKPGKCEFCLVKRARVGQKKSGGRYRITVVVKYRFRRLVPKAASGATDGTSNLRQNLPQEEEEPKQPQLHHTSSSRRKLISRQSGIISRRSGIRSWLASTPQREERQGHREERQSHREDRQIAHETDHDLSRSCQCEILCEIWHD